MKTALTIAGSDCSGGAGIQADLKTMTAYGVYGMSVITALTAQNTLGVTQNNLINADVVSAQLMSVLSDITPNAIKIGMLGNGQIATVVAEILQDFFSPSTQSPSSLQAHENTIPKSSIPSHANTIPIVIDPVLVSTSGKTLLDEDGIRVLTEQLFPMATLITPNIPESEYLCNRIFNTLSKPCVITNADDMIKAAQIMYRHYGCAILLKGGHATGNADDLLYDGTVHWFHASRINCTNTHGTGCTLSSAIASALCLGKTLPDAVHSAKEYVRGAMSTGLDLGHGNGPLNHCWNISK
ncbi:MAG: bifunctional hydroxymethylpyrimidine kinase/phosphomethylpyrimidine kinase [Clostridium sp.]